MSTSGRRRWIPRLLLGAVAFFVVLFVALGLGCVLLHEPLPQATPGPRAEALADRMLDAVNADAWRRDTGAVRWTFDGREHLWDTRRNLARVVDGDVTVWIDVNTRGGVAHRDGQRVGTQEESWLVSWAYAMWANDSFWLNPVVKLRDPGTTRGVVERDGQDALLVTYSSGGVTPGDSYLWHVGPDGRPTRWEMWVSILPIGGVDTSWEGWTELPTGAWVSIRHDLAGLMTREVSVEAGADLDALGEAGAFEVLGR